MNNIDTGGPAFPVADPFGAHKPQNVDEAKRLAEGMTLRDYFAAHATVDDIAAQINVLRPRCEMGILPENYMVICRYMHADAMLKARES